MRKPLAVDLYAGLGGWTEGLLAEGWDVIGFDNEMHVYGDHRYPAQLVLQDVRTIHGSQFRNASLIVASPPCQEYSYMAMPWTRAKNIAAEYRSGARDVAKLTELFDACFRIQREAIEAAGHFIPLVVENVRGAQPWVGRARWMYGSFALWGDVPALMPITVRAHAVKVKTMGAGWYHPNDPRHVPGLGFNTHADRATRQEDDEPKYILDDIRAGKRRVAGGVYDGETGRTTKNDGGSWFNVGHPPAQQGRNPVHDGVKQAGISGERANGKGDRWFQDGAAASGSKSSARKAASARIAKIPLPLARWIAKAWKPRE